MSTNYSAEDVMKLREATGMGMSDCKRALEMAFERNSSVDGDVLWAAGVVYAAGLAINVRHDREGWNLDHGAQIAEGMRKNSPNLNQVFPKRNTLIKRKVARN